MREFCAASGVVYQGFSLLTANRDVLTHPDVARIAADSTGGITVSTLKEAEHFAASGYRDILYAATIVPGKLAHAARIIEMGCDLVLVTDSPDVIAAASRFATERNITLSFLIEIDCGEHRSGLPAGSPATVTLARPPVNAQNRRFREEIITIFDLLSDRSDVRAVVLTGEGKTFSAGADLKERPTLGDPGAYPRHSRTVRASFDTVIECEKPVIAAVNGAAIGAGCVLALCCDILIASENAYFAMTEVDVGLAGGVSHAPMRAARPTRPARRSARRAGCSRRQTCDSNPTAGSGTSESSTSASTWANSACRARQAAPASRCASASRRSAAASSS